MHYMNRRFFRLPTLLLIAVVTGQIVGISSSYGQTVYFPVVHTGDSFRFSFDLASASLSQPPPYTQFSPLIDFAPTNQFGSGDGFTAQLFDSSGNASGDPRTILWTGADTFNLTFALPLYEPFPDTAGYIAFTDVVGSFALEPDQWVIGYGDPSSTGYVQARLEGVPLFSPVPEPSSYGMFGGICALGLIIRRTWRQNRWHGPRPTSEPNRNRTAPQTEATGKGSAAILS